MNTNAPKQKSPESPSIIEDPDQGIQRVDLPTKANADNEKAKGQSPKGQVETSLNKQTIEPLNQS